MRIPLSLITVCTRDDVRLAGVMAEPRRRREAIFVWVHGLGSTFASGQTLIAALAPRLTAAGIGYLKCDTRGHHIVARAGRTLGGGAFERFEACVEDLRAIVAFARHAGYRRVILAGHSTGANKVVYYASRGRHPGLAGVALLGPVSDIAGEGVQVGRRALTRRVAAAARLARRDPEALVPRRFGFWSARRYLSLYRPGAAEDVFPYYRPRARWTALGRVRVPMAVVFGERDEYLDRSAASLIETFRQHAIRAPSITGIVVPDANHGFKGAEEALVGPLVRWVRDVLA